jgi:hypothetical protein
MTANKKVGVPRPNKDKQKGKPGSMQDIDLLDNVILQSVWYMELAKDALVYLNHHKRLNRTIQFRFEVEVNLIMNQLKNWFGVSPAWVMKTAEDIRADKEKWQEEVKKFADLIAPEKSLIVTDNLEQELLNIKGRNALLGDQGPGKGPKVPPGGGRVII